MCNQRHNILVSFQTGLSLRLNIQQDEYLKYVSAEAGVRVIMHDQGVMPFPYLEGFSVSPGTATSVGIQKVSWTIDNQRNGLETQAIKPYVADATSVIRSDTLYFVTL